MADVDAEYADALRHATIQRENLIGDTPAIVAALDQASACLVGNARLFGVDLTDPDVARAAFVGAVSMFANLEDVEIPAELAGACVVELGCYPHLASLHAHA